MKMVITRGTYVHRFEDTNVFVWCTQHIEPRNSHFFSFVLVAGHRRRRRIRGQFKSKFNRLDSNRWERTNPRAYTLAADNTYGFCGGNASLNASDCWLFLQVLLLHILLHFHSSAVNRSLVLPLFSISSPTLLPRFLKEGAFSLSAQSPFYFLQMCKRICMSKIIAELSTTTEKKLTYSFARWRPQFYR